MNRNQILLLVAISLCFVTNSFSQKGNYPITNGFSFSGGITKFNITTDNFITKEGDGFSGGASGTVDIPLRFYNVSFGMQLSQNSISISGRPTQIGSAEEFIDYKVFAAQVALMGHIKVIENHFTIGVGPMLQYNGKLEFKDTEQEGYYINNYDNLQATDIANITQFNINGIVGASVGVRNFKLKAEYIYGFTNILKKLETEDIDTTGGSDRIKGNQTMLVFGATISF